jgi:hypothetical protein
MSIAPNLTPEGFPKLFDRQEIKATLMQASYAQQEKGSKAQLKEDLRSEYRDEIYDVFVQAVDELIPGFYSVMEFTNGLWQPDWTSVSFTMPDGVVVTCKPTTSDWVDFPLFEQMTVTAKVAGVQREEAALILWVTIIHAFDAYIARLLVLRCAYDILTIHDGFKVLANHTGETRLEYNKIIVEIASSQALKNILQEITGQSVDDIQGDLVPEEMLDAKYSLS